MNDLQRAPVSKRLFAFLLDVILASILIAGIYTAGSAVFRTDRYGDRYREIIREYEAEWGVSFDTTQAQFDAMSDEEKTHYREAVDAANADEEANRAIRASYRSAFLLFAGGILAAFLILEFAVPLLLGDGRTLGKRLFGLGVMRQDGVRVTAPVLFIRGVIGKGVLELILPILVVVSVLSGQTGVFGIALLVVFAAGEILAIVRSRTGALLHDVLAGTVAVDWASQRIFESRDAREAFYAERRRREAEQKEDA